MLPVVEVDEEIEGTLNSDEDAVPVVRKTDSSDDCSLVYFLVDDCVYGGLQVTDVDEHDGYLVSSIDGSLGEILHEDSGEEVFEDLLESVRENAVLSYLDENEIDQATLALNGKMYYESVRKPEEDTEWRNHSFFYSSLKTSDGEEIISGETILTDRFR